MGLMCVTYGGCHHDKDDHSQQRRRCVIAVIFFEKCFAGTGTMEIYTSKELSPAAKRCIVSSTAGVVLNNPKNPAISKSISGEPEETYGDIVCVVRGNVSYRASCSC